MAAKVVTTGFAELDETLSYLRTTSANRIARKAVSRMATIVVRYQRREIAGEDWAPKTSDRGISSRNTKGRLSSIKAAKAGIGVGSAQKKWGTVVNRGRRKGVGVSARNLHWFALGTQDRYTGAKSVGRKGRRRLVATGKARKFTGRIRKDVFGGFILRGAAAATPEALRAAEGIVQMEVAKEVAAARRTGSPTPGMP